MNISMKQKGFPGGSAGKESDCNVGDLGSIPGLGRSCGEGNGNPPQYSSLENPMDREAWETTVPGLAKESDITYQLNNREVGTTNISILQMRRLRLREASCPK